ncbi:MAG: hypothetical protein WC326_13025 [Candidatus Delongbacteria bacterium]
MLLTDLIARLEELAQEHPDAEVRLMTQQSWPFENSLLGLTTKSAITDDEDQQEAERLMGLDIELEDDEVGPRREPSTDPEIIYLIEGNQLGYGSKAAWAVCDRF